MFGQIVIGPPGSGKTTYCFQMLSFLKSIGRKSIIVNLDPANEHSPDETQNWSINILDLIKTKQVMNEYNLGPNGSLSCAYIN